MTSIRKTEHSAAECFEVMEDASESIQKQHKFFQCTIEAINSKCIRFQLLNRMSNLIVSPTLNSSNT